MRSFVSDVVLTAAAAAAAGESCPPDCRGGSGCPCPSCSESSAESGCDGSPTGSTPVSAYRLFDPDRPALTSWDGTFQPDDGPPGYDKPLSTNRPSFTPSVVPVGAGVFQLESGYTYRHKAGGPYDIHNFPELNPRLGVLDGLEVFGLWNYAALDPLTPGYPVSSGNQDAIVGTKIYVTPQRGFLPQLSLQPEINLPAPTPTAGSTSSGSSLWRPGGLRLGIVALGHAQRHDAALRTARHADDRPVPPGRAVGGPELQAG